MRCTDHMRYGILLLVLVAMLIWGAYRNAPVQSEDAHLASGASHWLFSRFDLYRVNPPLVRMIAAAPVIGKFQKDNSWMRWSENPLQRSEFIVGIDAARSRDDYFSVLLYSRILVAITFGVVGMSVCFFFSKHFFGGLCSFIGGLLWCANPYIMGHGITIFPDVPSAAMGAAAVWFFRNWLQRPDRGNTLITGIMLGLAELTKFTLMIFYPLFFIIWIASSIRGNSSRNSDIQKNDVLSAASKISLNTPVSCWRQFVHLVIMFAVSVLIINMGYIFEDTGKPLRDFRFQTTLFTGAETLAEVPSSGGNRFDGSGNMLETAIGYLPMPLPANYIQGIDTQRLDFERGLPSYLCGEWSDHGWWYYYLYALLIKTPLGTFGLLGLAIYCTFFMKGCNASWRDEMVILLPGIAILAFVSSQTGFSVHSRYIIPALPFFFIWISKVGKMFMPEVRELNPRSAKYVRGLAVFFTAWMIGSSLWVYPHSISYFNELAAILPTPYDKEYPLPLPETDTHQTMWQKVKYVLDAGPRNGPRHLLDSNIDWGQDLFELERWCQLHPEIKSLKGAYSGSYPIELTTIPNQGMPSVDTPEPSWYALSVNYLYDKSGQYRYFLNFTPVDYIGYSIYVYHIMESDIAVLAGKKNANNTGETLIDGASGNGGGT